MLEPSEVTRRLWSLCAVLRDDGISYQSYLNELSQLLFLKLADQLNVTRSIPSETSWRYLSSLPLNDLLPAYERSLAILSRVPDELVSAIFKDARTEVQTSGSLARILSGLDSIPWEDFGFEGLGNVYEGLIEKGAQESRYGAGQYFTPRPVVDALVQAMKPDVRDTIYDPAAGTAGFLVAAGALAAGDRAVPTLLGTELVPQVRKLALMNAVIHNLPISVQEGDALSRANLPPKVTICLTNPPFGMRGVLSEDQASLLKYPTNNKQLAFLQHVHNALADDGRAAVVVPENVLSESGVAAAVRRELLEASRLHTVLHLPTGIFYATGVKTSVLFFTKSDPVDSTWFYDMRTESRTFGKRTPLASSDFEEFLVSYGDDPNGQAPRTPTSRFHKRLIADIRKDGYRLDLRSQAQAGPEDTAALLDLLSDAVGSISTAQDALQQVEDLLRPYSTGFGRRGDI